MSQTNRPKGSQRSRRRGPHHVIITKGDKVRSFAVRPVPVIAGLVAVILAGGGAMTAAALVAFKDEAALTTTAEVERVRYEYESRIADLNRQIESVVSLHLVEREQMATQLDELAERQGSLIQRQQLLTGLASEAIAAGIDVLPNLAPLPVANPLRGADDPGGIGGPVDPTVTGTVEEGDQNAGIPAGETLAAVAAAADWLEDSQTEALMMLAEEVVTRSETLAEALDDLGFASVASDVGGPFVPDPGEIDFELVDIELDEFARLQQFARTLPLAAPLASIDVSSSYGRRVDPFTGQSAIHTGVDLRAASGTPVRATAPGVVVTAGTNGGYGKMVEIDHGNGIITAYAHMSSISVAVGDDVGVGTMVGRVGSTGRSTGPHLHYEVLRDGRTTDPMPFVRTGQSVADIL